MNDNKYSAKWYEELMSDYNKLTGSLELDESAASDMRDFLLEKCKDQYMRGNKSGIRWAMSPEGQQKLKHAV